MGMKKVPISEAGFDELVAFAATMQIDVTGERGKPGVLAKLGPAWEHDYILVAEEAVPSLDQTATIARREVKLDPKIFGADAAKDPPVIIRINETEMPGGKDKVPVGVNGKTLNIKRGSEVAIPYRFYEALIRSERGVVIQNPDTGHVTKSSVTNYPVVPVYLPPEEDVAKWRAAQAEVELA